MNIYTYLIFIYLVSFFWFVRTKKAMLFWIYLWQVKEYHIGRFLDNFRTYQGKKLLFGFLPLIKVFLFILILVNTRFLNAIIYILTLLYGAEAIVFLTGLFRGKFKRPIFTFKTAILTLVSSLIIIAYAVSVFHYAKNSFDLIFALLIFDIFLPLIISGIVLMLQPIFVLFRLIVLAKAKKKRRKLFNLTAIGITGSYGKTSTKEFLKTILSARFNVSCTREHKNSEMGIAKTILRELNEKHQIFVAEMGAYRKGGIKLLCDIVKPSIGIVTGVNVQHMALFGSMKNLLSAEGGVELSKALPEGGILAVNGDNKYCLNLYKKIGVPEIPITRKIYAAENKKVDADIFAKEIYVQKGFLHFIAQTKAGESARFTVNVMGRHNVQNLLGAILVANELGMSLQEISKACTMIKSEQAGIALKQGVNGIDVIDSSYSVNLDGVMADLDYLSIFPDKKIIIMPCLIELGKESVNVHEKIGRKIAEICDLAIITTKDKFKEVKRGSIMGGMSKDKVIFFAHPKKIFKVIKNFCKNGDVILLEGRVPDGLMNLLVKK